MDGMRVRVVLEPIDEVRVPERDQQALWHAWVQSGPQGPIADGPDTDLP
jgi:hypothetical protein